MEARHKSSRTAAKPIAPLPVCMSCAVFTCTHSDIAVPVEQHMSTEGCRQPAERVQSDIDLPGTPPGLDVGARPSPQQLEEALAGIKSAGALFPGNALVYQVGAKQVGVCAA